MLTTVNNYTSMAFQYQGTCASIAASISQGIGLAEVSEKDRVWDEHKAGADQVMRLYSGTVYNDYARRISFCSELLFFRLNVTGGISLSSSRFCRVRFCPVCQWRRSAMWKAKAHEAIPKVMEQYPNHRWLFLTLTIRNCDIQDLKQTVAEMNAGFSRFSRLAKFPGKGWIKSLEVTRSANGQAHPHFHVLILVSRWYFKGTTYVSKQKWSEMWQKSMRLDYLPVVDIRPIKETQDVTSIIPEILKYQTKVSDLAAERSWLLELTNQLHHTRAVAVGGVLREFMRELEEEPEDLIGEGDEEVIPDLLLGFRWRTQVKKYTAE